MADEIPDSQVLHRTEMESIYAILTAFKKGDQALYRAARANLKSGIRKAKANYKSKIKDCLQSINTRKYGREYSTRPTSHPENPWLTVTPPQRRS